MRSGRVAAALKARGHIVKSLMRSVLGRWLRPSTKGARGPIDGFMDSLVQTFENCRNGLSDEAIATGPDAVAAYFTAIYRKETPRLREAVHQHVPLESADSLWSEIDGLVGTVVVPGYSRLATKFTPRERNDFYFADRLHGLERMLWGAAGILIGVFVIWAPFIPVWSKEWILPFMIAGLLFPELRRYLALRDYEARLNLLVERADREVARLDYAYLLSPGHALARKGDHVPPRESPVILETPTARRSRSKGN